jgi:Holliday junction resolvase
MTNSRRKGKAGELEAVHYLRDIGFPDARRSQQFNGLGDSDITCEESLPNVHIECKRRKDICVGTASHQAAILQAASECGEKEWCVLWRRDGARIWKLTFVPQFPQHPSTVSGDEAIAACLSWLNSGTPRTP